MQARCTSVPRLPWLVLSHLCRLAFVVLALHAPGWYNPSTCTARLHHAQVASAPRRAWRALVGRLGQTSRQVGHRFRPCALGRSATRRAHLPQTLTIRSIPCYCRYCFVVVSFMLLCPLPIFSFARPYRLARMLSKSRQAPGPSIACSLKRLIVLLMSIVFRYCSLLILYLTPCCCMLLPYCVVVLVMF